MILSTRRRLIASALALGASPLLAGPAFASRRRHREAPERFPEGVASGDPRPDGVILWTRREPKTGESRAVLTVEVAEDSAFGRVVAVRELALSPVADWTCRVLMGGLKAGRAYWYRFGDADGEGSRIGRTRTAPHDDDRTAARFAFVSCQNLNLGPIDAWRRMVVEDERKSRSEQLDFVLHLGDFVYETVWSPQDRPKGYFDRTPRDLGLFPTGEKHDDYSVPVDVADYRALYRAYLRDPDLQAARARWPFVAIWDNGEYSDKGWQGLQRFGGVTCPAQTRKVAANQAWFEYMPARVRTTDRSLAAFAAPAVSDAPVDRFDDAGLGQEPNNLAAVASLTGYRTQRWGRHVELILTDQRSYRSEDYTAAPEAKSISSKRFPQMVPYETLRMIDAGRDWPGGPPERLRYADADAPNFRKDKAPPTLLGAEQKAWFLDRLAASTATWKVWGDTVATLDMRADPQNLPPALGEGWPGRGYAGFPRTDHSTAFAERAQIYDLVADRGITGFVTLSGDRHSFWAGYASKSLPPEGFAPIGVTFVAGSISSPGMVEALKYILPKQHLLRPLYLVDRPGRTEPEPTVNLLLHHGVRACLDYAARGDIGRAKGLSDPDLAPHVAFVDMAGHGYGLVHASARLLEVEFVCTARPVAPTAAPAGQPLVYRIVHRASLWRPGEAPKLTAEMLEGDASLCT